MGQKAQVFPGFSSGSLLFGCTNGQGTGTGGLVLINRFGLGEGGGFNKWTRPPYNGLLLDIQHSVHLPKTTQGFCLFVDSSRGSLV